MHRRHLLLATVALGIAPVQGFGQVRGETRLKTVSTKGAELTTQAFGAGGRPSLVLIMGATASMLGWPDDFCDQLAAQGLEVIRFDHRDTGGSTTHPPGPPAYAVEDMAEDVLAILDAYGLTRAHLVGMSLGGLIAQMIAVQAPDRVGSLTLIASEPLGWDGAPLPHISDAVLAQFGRFAGLDWSDRTAVAEFLYDLEQSMTGARTAVDAAASRARIAQVLARTDSVASSFNHASLDLRDDWTGRFREIEVPTLVIHGEQDPVLPVANGRAIAVGIATADLLVLPGVGHELPAAWIPDLAQRIGDLVRS